MITLIISAILLAFAGFCTGGQDYEMFRNGYKAGQAWRNKYATDERGALIAAPKNWYYRLYKIKYKERFPLSATLFVAFTDKWHTWKTAAVLSYRLAFTLLPCVAFSLSALQCVGVFVGASALHMLFFHIKYTWL